MDTIISSTNEDGYITHRTPERIYRYNAVRMGLAWATEHVPAYLCVFGNLYSRKTLFRVTTMGPIRMIAEAQIDTMSMTEIWDRVLDAAKTLWCEEVYCDLSPLNIGYRENFRQYTAKMDYKRPFPSLHPAPYADNFIFGFQLGNDWRLTNKVQGDPDSMLGQQLAGFNLMDDFVDYPERRFNAINAYRYVLASFQRNLGLQENMVPKRRVPLYMVET